MQTFTVHAEYHDRLDRTVGGTEPVRSPRAEFDGFARFDDEVTLTEDEAHSPGQHISPVLPFVNR